MKAILTTNPRSVLHALEPQGLGTSAVESLISYFCRLAVSHSTSVTALSKVVTQTMEREFNTDFDWRDRNLSGIGESAIKWSSALSAMTSVGRLDQLTVSSWKQVLAPRSLMAPSTGKWCPHCLDDDRQNGTTPYFRLAWDIKAVTACERHATQLVCTCPDCGQTGIRHKAAYVVPGWCTQCGAFFGSTQPALAASPEAVWIATQVGKLLAVQASIGMPGLTAVQQALTTLVIRMNQGNSAAFGSRVGVAKSTVHCWTRGKTALTLETALRIADATGLSVDKLLSADLKGWAPPINTSQLDLDLELGSRQRTAPDRNINWDELRARLMRFAAEPAPISLAEAARRLEIEASYLYLHANNEARLLSARWQAHAKRRAELKRQQARESVLRACRKLTNEGKAVNMREIRQLLTVEELGAAKHLIDMLTEIKQELGIA